MMVHRGSSFLLLSWLLVAAPVRSEPVLDLHGDPLPAGAIARMGSARWNHGARVGAVLVSGDGKTVASFGDDGILKFWEPANGKMIRQLQGLPAAQMLSPDGSLLATADRDGSTRLHDAATGMERSSTPGNPVVFSPDGKTLLTNEFDRAARTYTLRLVDTANGNVAWSLTEQPLNVYCADISADGRLLALGCGDGIIYLHEMATGKEVGRCMGHRGYVQAVAFTPDGKGLASASKDLSMRRWDVASGKEQRCFDGLTASRLVFSSDGKTLTALSAEQRVCRIIDAETGKVQRALAVNAGLRLSNALSRDGRVLAGILGVGTLRVWDLQQPEPEVALPTAAVAALAFSPDGKLLASGCGDHRVYLWDAATGKLLRRLHGHQSGVNAVAFSADGQLLASGAGFEDFMVCVWETATGKEQRLLPGHQNGTQSLHFEASGSRLLAATRRGTARYWDAATGRELPLPLTNGFSLAFTDDGRRYAHLARSPVNANMELLLVETATGKPLRKMTLAREQRAARLAVSPDARWIVLAAANSPFADERREHLYDLWDTTTGKKVRSFGALGNEPTRTAAQNWLTFSPDGRLLADTERAGRVRLWEMTTGHERQALEGQPGAITAGVFSPDGNRFATAGNDGQILVWDLFGLQGGLPAAALAPADLEAAWNELGDHGQRGAAALRRLMRGPGQTLPYLRDQLKPVAPLAADRTARLVADLDSNQFETRDQATKELEAAGEPAAAPLRKVLAETKPSLEMRQRIEGILQRLDGTVVSAERLRIYRALEILERLDSTESRAVLKVMAGGVPESRITQEAAAALERLARRASARP
ncbi:MAG: WD40 repeat domain-containing protein [Planctomycetia bacterium]|nr:WD40 repeat domain-containing protein [Planctomycetia bacterium]